MSVHPGCLSVAAFVVLFGCSDRAAKPVNQAAQVNAPANDTKAVASEDQERIQGTWNFVTLVNGSQDRIVVEQDKISFHVRGNTVEGTFVLDSTTQPKRIDLSFAANPDSLVAPQGIYEFRKDLLVLCLATVDGFRPAEFKADERQNLVLLHRPTPEDD